MPAHVVAFDLSRTMAFLRSVAVTRALTENTHARWSPEMGNTVVNLMYNIMPWKARFGVMDVHQPSRRYLAERTAQLYRHFVMRWLEETHRGPFAAKEYLDKMNAMRDNDLGNLKMLFAEVESVNQQVLGEMGAAIRAMAFVQMTGTIAVACLGAYAAIAVGGTVAVMAGAVGTGYSVTNSVIKTWGAVPTGSAIGVACKYGEGIGGEGLKSWGSNKLGDMSAKLFYQAGDQAAKEKRLWDDACRNIDRYSQQAAQSSRGHVRRSAEKQLARNIARKGAAEAGGKSAAWKMVRSQLYRDAIPVIFALWETVDAIDDFNEVCEATR